jgi:ABC-type transport system involved in cytochrome bd biosynthesis fused ATPase/permease subunit
MSRVWKRFMFKLFRGASFVAYLSSAIIVPTAAAAYLGYPPQLGIFFGLMFGILLPMLFVLLRDVYYESKREVEQENNKLMRDLGRIL